MKHLEYDLQKRVCAYIEWKYPNVLFLSDTIANIRLTAPQQTRNKAIQKKGFKCPDLLILQPNEQYKGLFIELKQNSPFKRDGLLKSNEHLQGQQLSIDRLNELGYYACFAWSFDMTKQIIDDYLATSSSCST